MKCPYRTKIIHKPEYTEGDVKNFAEDITAFCDCVGSECPFYFRAVWGGETMEYCRRVEREIKKMTKREKAIVTAYTGILMGELSDFYEYIEKKLGRPVWTHEFADKGLWDEIKDATKEDFLSLCSDDE